MADYLEAYRARFELPVLNGVNVDRVFREGRRYLITAGDRRFEADQVVVAMSSYQKPRIPSFANQLDPRIVQLHSCDYRSPAQLADGGVLIAGAGNSGAEIAVEVSRSHHTWMAGRDTGEVPFRIGGLAARLFLGRLLLRVVFHRVLTTDTPMGRKARAGGRKGGLLIRTKSADLAAAGVDRVAKVTGVRNGKPVLADGRVLDPASVVWCTGFDPGLSWIDLPIFDADGEPKQERGIVAGEPGLYLVGRFFLYAFSSSMIHGVSRDADRVARTIGARVRAATEPVAVGASAPSAVSAA
jgi:putative flavoprotein involved in K+ transport